VKVLEPTAHTTVSDNTLITDYLAGDERAFGVLYNRYYARVTRFLFRKIGDWESSQDLCQDTFIRVHRSLARFRMTHRFSTWVYTIAANLAKNHHRNQKRSCVDRYADLSRVDAFENGYAINLLDTGQDPHRDFEKETVIKMLTVAVGELSQKRRQVFVLRELEGKTYEEIAETAGLAMGTVKSRLNRAREEVRISIRNQGYE